MWPSGRHLYCGSRDLPKHISFATCIAILSIAHPTLFTPEAKAQESCKPAVVGTGTVASVRDGRTVLLTDGREVRLAAIEVVDSSRDALRSLVDGRELQLMRLGSDQDRYGRVVAFVRIGDAQQSIQEMLVAQGQARVAARIGDKACADILLRSERVARASAARSLGRPQFRPFAPGTSRPDCSRAGPICTGRGQGIVGARKRRHNIFEFRAALDARLHGNDS